MNRVEKIAHKLKKEVEAYLYDYFLSSTPNDPMESREYEIDDFEVEVYGVRYIVAVLVDVESYAYFLWDGDDYDLPRTYEVQGGYDYRITKVWISDYEYSELEDLANEVLQQIEKFKVKKNMKETIKQVECYFRNRLLNKDFIVTSTNLDDHGNFTVRVKINNAYEFALHIWSFGSFVQWGYMTLEFTEKEKQILVDFVNEQRGNHNTTKLEKIEQLKRQIEKLESELI